MSEIKDYGEPWRAGLFDTTVACRDTEAHPVKDWPKEVKIERRDRAIACVNALAGRDPEKLEGLLEAVRNLINKAQVTPESCLPEGRLPSTVHSFAEDFDAVITELAAFEGGRHE